MAAARSPPQRDARRRRGDGGRGTGGAPLGDGGVPLDAGPSAPGTIALPPDYAATSEYGNARGVLCDGRDPAAWRRPDVRANEPRPRDHVGLGRRAVLLRPGNRLDTIRRAEQPIDSFATGIAVSPTTTGCMFRSAPRTGSSTSTSAKTDPRLRRESGRCRRCPSPDSDGTSPKIVSPGHPAAMGVARMSERSETPPTCPPTPPSSPPCTSWVASGCSSTGNARAHAGASRTPGAAHLAGAQPADKLLYVAQAGDPDYLTRIAVRVSRII